MLKKLPHVCPSCASPLRVKSLICGNCSTEVTGEFELQLWADEDHTVQCRKTKDLNPLKGDPNVIVIKLVADPYNFDEGE